jgi:polyisoprenoid-binding protein YceI
MPVLQRCCILLLWGILFWVPGFAQNNFLTDSKVSFRISNADIVAKGRFESLHTEIHFDPEHPEQTRFSSKIEVESIKTGIRLRDQHLKRPVYFDAKLFPTIDVTLTSIQVVGKGSYSGEFLIRMKGIEKKIRIAFSMKEEGSQFVFEGRFPINRRDFKVGGKSWTLSNQVDVEVRFVVLPLRK